MILFIVSFVAGILTVLAPCILPLLPVILAGSVTETKNSRRPFVIIVSLSLSVLAFTLLLKGSTALITISPSFWTYISGGIIGIFGLTLIFPEGWARLVLKIPGHNKPDSWISRGYGKKNSFWTDVIVGAALGPVFTTCSPTFFIIIATVLPQSFAIGIIDLAAYILGLALSLLIISWIGQRLINRLEWATNPYGWFKKTLGAVFIVVSLFIVTGFDKQIEASILGSGFFDVTRIEQSVKQYLENISARITINDTSISTLNQDSNTIANSNQDSKTIASSTSLKEVSKAVVSNPNYIDIANPAGFINSQPFKLADIVGKKVILIDFIDYSCINCERTFPYLADWYQRYKDQGLEVVAIHTPEFAFEKKAENVQKAADQFGLKFPIVLDNDYSTWNAYSNQYWPHKYLIDIHGHVAYDHVGEGGYAETEAKIVDLLKERKQALNESGGIVTSLSSVPEYQVQTQSPETYFGAMRNTTLGNGLPLHSIQSSFTIPDSLTPNTFYLGGDWNIKQEYIEAGASSSQLAFIFSATNMYLIAESADEGTSTARVLLDGKEIPDSLAGKDVKGGVLNINASRLYHIYSGKSIGTHRIDVIFSRPGMKAYTFTFG